MPFLSLARRNAKRVFLMCCLVQLLLVGSSQAAVSKSSATRPQNPFLKEILMGRCYENPPNQSPEGGAQLCPVLVPALIGVLEGQLDENVKADDYYMYLGWTKYEQEPDSSLFVWPPPSSTILATNNNKDWMLPETTPSGSLVHGLVFCGTDKRMNCPTEFWQDDAKGALASFWQAVYADFALKAKGIVKMILLLQDDMPSIPTFWNDSVLANLDAKAVTRVEIMSSNCHAPGVSVLMEAIQSNNIETSCAQVVDLDRTAFKDGEPANACEIAHLLQSDLPETDPATPDTGMEPIPPPTTPSKDYHCNCPTSVYAYLFWSLILLGAAGAFSLWSVWHYIPHYQRIPNVELGNGQTGEGVALPKQ